MYVRLRLFGVPRLRSTETGLETGMPGKTGELLAYLALYPDRAHSRGRLAGLFWGGHREELARRCLSTALWRVRERLALMLPDTSLAVHADRHQLSLRLGEGLDVDVHEFERAVGGLARGRPVESPSDATRVERALELYEADLLDGYFSDWVLLERERLRRLRLTALVGLMRFHRLREDLPRAIELGREFLRVDPFEEDVLREVMRLHERAGQRASALELYQWARRVLKEELDAEPMAETRSLYERIRRPHTAM